MKNGSTKTSVSQKTCMKYDMPLRPRAPTETVSLSGWPVLMRWWMEKRSASCAAASPSTTRSLSRQRAAHAASCRASSSSKPRSSARRRARTALSREGKRVRAETMAASRSTVAGSPASRRPPMTSRAWSTVRSTGEPAAGRVLTASTWPPPLRPRVLATKPGPSPGSKTVSRTGPPACVTPTAPSQTMRPEKSSGTASARSAITARSSSEAKRAVRTLIVRPPVSRCRQ